MANFKLKHGAIAVAVSALCVGGAVSARQTAPAAPAAAVKAPVPAAVKPAVTATLDKPVWKELTRPQQIALEPLQGEWDKMEGLRKQKWLDIANRYSSMKPDEQARVQERMRAWIKMTPEERRVVRENYNLSKKIDKTQKSAQWEQYKQLPEEEKRKLAADAATKKSGANLPPKATVKAGAPASAPAASPVVPPPVTTPPPANPAAPVPNAK
jgi:hypothetical protein